MTELLDGIERNTGINNRLHAEIAELRLDGYEVSIGDTPDRAYDNPSSIESMYDRLYTAGLEYASRAKDMNRLTVGAAAVYRTGRLIPGVSGLMPPSFRRAYKRRESALEDIRAEILFDPSKMPWHKERGKALALQTTVDAHDLITVDGNDGGGLYYTMAGRLPVDLDEARFEPQDGKVANMTLEEAIAATGQIFHGKPLYEAEQYAQKTIVELREFLNAPVTEDFKSIVVNCQDSLGIRSRQQEVRREAALHVDRIVDSNPDEEELVLMSIGCGTAQSIIEVASDIRDRGLTPRVILLDQDPVALAAARQLAKQSDLAQYIELHCERLFDRRGRPLDLDTVIKGRTVHIGEDSGLREYLTDDIYTYLTRAVWDRLGEGGVMLTGNMNASRPQPEFLHGLMGWKPDVKMRAIRESFRLHELSGVPRGATRARVTRDGVYSVFVSQK